MRRPIALLLVLGLFPAVAISQCNSIVSAPDGDPTSGAACNVIPWGQSTSFSAGYTYIGHVPANFMDLGNPYVADVEFAPCGTGTWSCGTVVIGIGHVPSPLPSPFNFPTFDAAGVQQTIGSFNDFTILHNSFPTGTIGPLSTTGTFNWNVTQDTWSPMGFAMTGGTGFTWNGVDDVAFFVTYLSSTVTGFSGNFHRETLIRSYGAGYNLASATTNGSASALKIQFQVSQGIGLPSVPTWQCNQVNSSADVNGAPDPGPIAPMVTQVAVGAEIYANFGGLAGMPYELAATAPEPGLAVGAGGVLTPGNQAININLAAPSAFLLFGGALNNSFVPNSIPITAPYPVTVSFQQLVLDPTSADGGALSHLNQLEWAPCTVSNNFDSLASGPLSGSNAPIAWTSPSLGGLAWTVNSGGTSSSATGPTAAFNGNNYLYCETSGGTNATFAFDTCGQEVTSLTSGTLVFQLSAIGATIGTLNVYQGDGAGNFNATPIFSQTGADPTQSQGGTEWTTQIVQITSFPSPLISFRFEYLSGTSFTGDLAIDDILLM